jgi:hypothetical protein
MKLTAAIVLAALAFASSAQAHYIDHRKDAYWQGLLDKSRESGFQFERSCFPNEPGSEPYCSLSMQSTDQNGKQIRLMEFYDAINELMYRMICFMKDVSLLT